MSDDADATPPDHVVIALRIERALLPDWWDEVRQVAARHVRRIALIDKPEEWIVRCELPRSQVEVFHAEIAGAWAEFDRRRAKREQPE